MAGIPDPIIQRLTFMRTSHFLLPLTALVLAACGDSGYEATIGQRLELQDGDMTGSTIARERSVDALFDEQWAPFLDRAEQELGHAPTEVALNGASLQLDAANSQGVGRLEDALMGEVVLYLRDPATELITDVAKVKDPKGTGRVELDMLDADLSALQQRLLSGDFRVGVRGTTPKPADSDFKLALSISLEASAK